jgi:hypothetical protein
LLNILRFFKSGKRASCFRATVAAILQRLLWQDRHAKASGQHPAAAY